MCVCVIASADLRSNEMEQRNISIFSPVSFTEKQGVLWMASYLSRCLLSCAACLGELQWGGAGRRERGGGLLKERKKTREKRRSEDPDIHTHTEVESAKLKFIVGSKFRCRRWFMSESHLNFVALLQEQKAMLCIQAVVYSMYVRPPSIDPSNDSPAYNQASCQSSTSQSCFFSLATTHVKKKTKKNISKPFVAPEEAACSGTLSLSLLLGG